MSGLLQEIKDYLDSIRHNAVRAALAKDVNEYGVCLKNVSDCEEALLSLFRKLDREYWELLERFGQLQAKVERYEKALEYIQREIHKAIYTPKKQKWNSDFEREFESEKTRGLIQASDIVKEAIEKWREKNEP